MANGRVLTLLLRGLSGAALLIAAANSGQLPEPAQAARPSLYPPPITTTPKADGTRFVVWQEGGTIRSLQDGQPWEAAASFPAPFGCGRVVAAGGGQAAFGCPAPPSSDWQVDPALLDLASGAVSQPAGLESLRDFERKNTANSEYYFVANVGAEQVEIGIVGNHVDSSVFLGWRSGVFRDQLQPTSLYVPSLDAPQGRSQICGPLRIGSRKRTDEYGFTYRRFDAAHYESPYLVIEHRGRLVLRRCGSKRSRVIASRYIGQPLVTKSYVAWATATRLHLLRFGTRSIQTYVIPSGQPTIQGTNGTVLVSVQSRTATERLVLDLQSRAGTP